MLNIDMNFILKNSIPHVFKQIVEEMNRFHSTKKILENIHIQSNY